MGVGAGVPGNQQVLNKYMEKEEFSKPGAPHKEALAGCSEATLGGEGSAKEFHGGGLSSLLPTLPPSSLPPSVPPFPSSITDKKIQKLLFVSLVGTPSPNSCLKIPRFPDYPRGLIWESVCPHLCLCLTP